MKKMLTFSLVIIGSIIGGQHASALSTPNTSNVVVSSISTTSAQVQVDLRYDEVATAARNRQSIKIQWRPWMCGDDQVSGQVCPAIYVQPFTTILDYDSQGNLLPVVLTNLKPATKYRVWLGYDNGIRCITAPCPSDTFQNQLYSFMTMKSDYNPYENPAIQILTQKLYFGVRGTQVQILENFLQNQGYMNTYVDSFYGTITHAAIMKFQTDHNLKADGVVGTKTRNLINQILNTSSNKTVVVN
jgi:peptidoglycan hydrolase-like protein with peptidoglycan-binding domain